MLLLLGQLHCLFGESLRVTLGNLGFRRLNFVFLVRMVAAASAAAFGATDSAASETLTVELEAPRFRAGALKNGRNGFHHRFHLEKWLLRRVRECYFDLLILSGRGGFCYQFFLNISVGLLVCLDLYYIVCFFLLCKIL